MLHLNRAAGYTDSVMAETSPSWDLERRKAIIYQAQALLEALKDFIVIGVLNPHYIYYYTHLRDEAQGREGIYPRAEHRVEPGF